mgnify:CR=1 FL=1
MSEDSLEKDVLVCEKILGSKFPERKRDSSEGGGGDGGGGGACAGGRRR